MGDRGRKRREGRRGWGQGEVGGRGASISKQDQAKRSEIKHESSSTHDQDRTCRVGQVEHHVGPQLDGEPGRPDRQRDGPDEQRALETMKGGRATWSASACCK